MTAFFRVLLEISVLAFSVSTMLSVGLGHTLHDIFGPMRDSRAVVRALIANFVLVPLLAYGLVGVLPLESAHGTGLILVATAAGAPFLIKLTMMARGNQPLSASLLMLLLLMTVLFMPFAVPLLVPGAKVSPVAIALPLLLTMILPMAGGMIVRARYGTSVERLQPWLGRVSTTSLVVTLVATIAANAGALLRLISEGAIFAPVLLILGAFVVGYALGREYRGGHVVLGLGTAQRNIAAAMVVATQGLDDPDVVVMVVVASLVGFAVLFPIAWCLGWRSRRRERVVRA